MFAPSYGLFLLLIPIILFFNYISLILINKKDYFVYAKKISLYIFCFALLIRFAFIYIFPFGSGFDISSFHWAGRTIIEKKDIYQTIEFRHRYSFLPAFAIASSYFIRLESYGLPYVFTQKLPVIVFDSLIAVIIFKITRKKIPALVYSVSPIPIILSVLYGQFDSIVLFFTVLALYLLNNKKVFLSFLSLGIAVAVKPWALIFLLIILPKTKKIFLYLMSFFIPSLISVILYKTLVVEVAFFNMIKGISQYSSVLGWWGPAAILKIPAKYFNRESILFHWGAITKILSVIVVFLLGRIKYIEIYKTAKWFVLIIYIISFGFAIHYLLWIFPFALITRDKLTKSYMLICGNFIILVGLIGGLTYNFTPPYIPEILTIILSQILWLFFILWFTFDVRQTIRKYLLSY
ncbi:hypothetical protein HYT02_05005 [Candidatus Gottesmanbacteria bacterium]|nr:hypothetical protein [Candidatus Gottesmanbacteria bacterium]